MNTTTALLLLADSRLPAGGHAHSGGLEAAVAAGRIPDLAALREFLRGRLATTGLVSAAFAARACDGTVADLDALLDARTPSPALRRASRAQGRALVRAGRAMWPHLADLGRPDPHHPIALGTVAAAAGLTAADAALAAAYGCLTGPASAAVRLLSWDPYPVQALLAELAGECDAVAGRAYSDPLPAAGAPLLDISAEVHADWEVRLFVS